jgi:hypothetical protein
MIEKEEVRKAIENRYGTTESQWRLLKKLASKYLSGELVEGVSKEKIEKVCREECDKWIEVTDNKLNVMINMEIREKLSKSLATALSNLGIRKET